MLQSSNFTGGTVCCPNHFSKKIRRKFRNILWYFVNFSLWEQLHSSPAGCPLYQRQHLFSLICLLCSHRMTPQNNTKVFSSLLPSTHSCLHLVKAFFAHSLPCKNIVSFSSETLVFCVSAMSFDSTFFKNDLLSTLPDGQPLLQLGLNYLYMFLIDLLYNFSRKRYKRHERHFFFAVQMS